MNSDSGSECDENCDYDIADEVDESHPYLTDESDDEDSSFFNKTGDVEWMPRYRESELRKKLPLFDVKSEGFNVDSAMIKTPRDAFLHFFDEETLDLVVKYTKAEAAAAGDDRLIVDRGALLAWIGVLVNAGVMGCNSTSIELLWSNDTVNGTGFYRAVMAKNSFERITRYIRFDDSVARRTPRPIGTAATVDYDRPRDRLQIVRPVMERIRRNFIETYSPGRNLTVDERIVSYRGRCQFKIYMKAKPSPYGMKIWGVADAENAYFMNFDVYAGKMNGKAEVGQGRRVVLQMVENYFHTGRRIVFDNFFTSVPLCEELLENGLTSIGTLRKNKKEIPVEFQSVSERASKP